jgi:transcription elongation GreA/GreB family factor
MKDTPMTHTSTLAADAHVELTERLAALQAERGILCEQMSDAPRSDGMGDQTEAQISIALVDNQIRSVVDRLQALKTDVTAVRFVCEDEDGAARVFTLVHPELSDPAKGFVSPTSPIGRALEHAHAGDSVTVRTPKGLMELSVVSVDRGV